MVTFQLINNRVAHFFLLTQTTMCVCDWKKNKERKVKWEFKIKNFTLGNNELSFIHKGYLKLVLQHRN